MPTSLAMAEVYDAISETFPEPPETIELTEPERELTVAEFFKEVLSKLHGDMRLKLAGDPACVPLSEDRSEVCAGAYVAGCFARDPSDIESLELIAHGAAVGAVTQNS